MKLLQTKHEMQQRAHPTVNTNIANVLSKMQGGEVWGEGGSRAAEREAERGQKKNWTNRRGSFQKNNTPPQHNKTKTGPSLTSQEKRLILAMIMHTEVGSHGSKDLNNTGPQTPMTQQIVKKAGVLSRVF